MAYWNLPELRVDGAVITLQVFTGTVVGSKTWTETRISSSGGGGYIVKGTGYVSGTRISSDVTRHDELFVRDELGNERDLRLTNVDLPVRQGSRVSTVLGIYEGHSHGYYVGVYNHDTRVWTPFKDGVRRLYPSPDIRKPLLLGAGGLLCFAVAWLHTIAWLALACSLVWVWLEYEKSHALLESQLKAALSPLWHTQQASVAAG